MTDRIATARIARWIDGDTLVVESIDPGWGVELRATHPSDQRCHIRLAGVNAPDKTADAKWDDPQLAAAALAYAEQTWPVGTTIVLTSYGFDHFGRTIADVTIGDPGVGLDVAAQLVKQGYARTGDYPTPQKEGA